MFFIDKKTKRQKNELYKNKRNSFDTLHIIPQYNANLI